MPLEGRGIRTEHPINRNAGYTRVTDQPGIVRECLALTLTGYIMPKKTKPQPITDLTFEQAFAELEESVRTLERGDLPLEESLALYERAGISHIARHWTKPI